MNQLLCQLENFYRSKNIEAKLNEEGTAIDVLSKIAVGNDVVEVKCCVKVDERDFRKYYFICPLPGHVERVTGPVVEQLREFNEKTSRVKLYLDEKQNYKLLFDKTFHNLDYFHVDILILDEAIKAVVTMQTFVEHHYEEILSIVANNA